MERRQLIALKRVSLTEFQYLRQPLLLPQACLEKATSKMFQGKTNTAEKEGESKVEPGNVLTGVSCYLSHSRYLYPVHVAS